MSRETFWFHNLLSNFPNPSCCWKCSLTAAFVLDVWDTGIKSFHTTRQGWGAGVQHFLFNYLFFLNLYSISKAEEVMKFYQYIPEGSSSHLSSSQLHLMHLVWSETCEELILPVLSTIFSTVFTQNNLQSPEWIITLPNRITYKET